MRRQRWFVDIPNLTNEEMTAVAEFETREAAIRYAMSRFGADDEGWIALVSGPIATEEEEEEEND